MIHSMNQLVFSSYYNMEPADQVTLVAGSLELVTMNLQKNFQELVQ